jgi:hypothetical protein
MSATLSTRLSLLEERLKVIEAGGIWVDMLDTKVRIDIGTRRGKEIEFPTVFQAAKYVERWMEKAVEVRGVVFVSNIADLMNDRPFIEMPDKWLKHSGVILNLAKWVDGSLEDIAIGSWTRMHPDPVEIPY